MADWIILRCSPSKTLRLAESLAADGFDVWTPVETRRVRIPRANARRDVRVAMLPRYVFARSAHECELLELAALKPRRGRGLRLPAHPDFMVIHSQGRCHTVAERDLVWLRGQEAKRTPRAKAERALEKGTQARVTEGVFGGMIGLVQRSRKGTTLLILDGGRRVEIPTSILADEAARMAA